MSVANKYVSAREQAAASETKCMWSCESLSSSDFFFFPIARRRMSA